MVSLECSARSCSAPAGTWRNPSDYNGAVVLGFGRSSVRAKTMSGRVRMRCGAGHIGATRMLYASSDDALQLHLLSARV
eukprot:488805-Prymnesium_polylepis.1